MASQESHTQPADQAKRLVYESILGCRAVEAARQIITENAVVGMAALVLEVELRAPSIESGIQRGHISKSSLEEMRHVPERYARDNNMHYWQVMRARQIANLALADIQMLDEAVFRADPAKEIPLGDMLEGLDRNPSREISPHLPTHADVLNRPVELQPNGASDTVTAS